MHPKNINFSKDYDFSDEHTRARGNLRLLFHSPIVSLPQAEIRALRELILLTFSSFSQEDPGKGSPALEMTRVQETKTQILEVPFPYLLPPCLIIFYEPKDPGSGT